MKRQSYKFRFIRFYKDSLKKKTIASRLQNHSTIEFGRIMKR